MWIVILLFLVIVYLWWNSTPSNNGIPTIEKYSPYYAIPDKNAFLPLSTPLDQRYVYLPNINIYLLPFEHLNFEDPFSRWMYYYYPNYYAPYYNYYWPFNRII